MSQRSWRAIYSTVAHSESLSDLDHLPERVYWRVLAQTDAWGRLPGSSRKVKAICLPMVDVSIDEVSAALAELVSAGRVQRYEVDGEEYLQVVDFDAYQPPDLLRRRGASKYPAPPERDGLTRTSSGVSPDNDGEVSPTEQERTEQDPLAPASGRRDIVWDAVAELLGFTPASGTSAHGKRNKAVKDLKAHGATPATIRGAADAYRAEWPDVTLTDTALAVHYPKFAADAQTADAVKRASAAFRTLEEFITDGGWAEWGAFEVKLAEAVADGLRPRDAQRLQQLAAELRDESTTARGAIAQSLGEAA